MIEIVDGGMATTVQDFGRPGYRSLGVALSGALDPVWLACANALVGNARDTAGLEMRGRGATLKVSGGRLRLALAGAEGRLQRAAGSTALLPPWQSATLEEGDALQVGTLRGGVAYLALAGGVGVLFALGSRSTYVGAQIGGLEGRWLRAGDRMSAGGAGDLPDDEWTQPAPHAHASGPVRVMPGPQDDHFSAETLRALTAADYRVSRDADRMGMRLEGPPLAHERARGGEIVSDGVTPGAIQVPPDGKPILLLADCQTVGGYPKIATLIRADLPRLAHLRPGDRIRFSLVTRRQAIAALKAQAESLEAWIGAIAPLRLAGSIDEEALYGANLVSGVVNVLSFENPPDGDVDPGGNPP